ncbi:MAG: CHAT domain-containing protein, partial [Chloroflexi bacterium]|nr:CHAT domain-containing protein [Chloroflexota bacterium]
MADQFGGVDLSGSVNVGGDVVGLDKTTIVIQPGQLAEAALRRLAQPYYLRVLVVVSAPIPDLAPRPPSFAEKGESLPSLNFQQEWADLRRTVLNSHAPILLVRLQPPTLDALRYVCSPQARAQGLAPHVVHFIGHGSPESVILEDEFGLARRIPSAEIAAALEEGGVKMAVMNSCYSAASLTPHSPLPVGEGQGVRAVIGHRWAVGDRAAMEFAGALHRELIGGRAAGECFDRAKAATQGADSAAFDGDRSLAFVLPPVPAHLPGEPLVEDGLPPNNVPRAAHFVGRAGELAGLARALAEAQTKAAVITGIGGIGKSALAQEAAHR